MRLFRSPISRLLCQAQRLPVGGLLALLVAMSISIGCADQQAASELTARLQTLGIRVVESVPSDTALRVVFENQQDYDEMLVLCLVLKVAAEYAPEDGFVEGIGTRDGRPLLEARTPAANVDEFVERRLSKRLRAQVQQLLTGELTPEEATRKTGQVKEIVVTPSVEKPREEKIQTRADDIAHALVALGLENVRVAWQYNGALNIQFENRTYRSDAAALGAVMETVTAMVEPKTLVNVVPLRDKVILGRFTFRAQTYKKFQVREIDRREMTQELEADLDLWGVSWPEAIDQGTPTLNSSRGRFDLLLRPGLEYRIGDELDPFESTPLLRPELTATLAKGLRGSVRGRMVLDRWGWSIDRALLTKTARASNQNLLWAVSIGKFRHNRYGGLLQGEWVDGHDRTRLGTRLAVVGIDFGNNDFQMRTGYLEREFGKVGLTARATYGRFLELGRTGHLVELERRFGESTLRLGGTLGLEKRRLLLRLSLPLGNRRAREPKQVRARISPSVDLDYTSTLLPVGDAMWDAPDLRGFRGELTLPYIRSHPERLVAGMALPSEEDEWHVAPSFEGVTGLIRTPSADVIPDGHYVLGCSWIPKQYTSGVHKGRSRSRPTFATVGFLPNLELNFRFTFYDDVTPQFSGIVTQWPYDLDRSFSGQYRLWRQKGWRPALVIGAQDIKFGDDSPKVGRAEYIVGTRQLNNVRLHLGTGGGRYRGIFGGIETRLGDHIKLIGEYDTNDVNLGLRLHSSHGLTLDAAWLDTADFGAAVSYEGTLP